MARKRNHWQHASIDAKYTRRAPVEGVDMERLAHKCGQANHEV